ncbi:DUF2207 domain-containing protein [Leuconostoc suionicum]|uniref:DUF2207 domain-containing protein n=1 Tax=Leuconostoc suionicum TaxID=1511761 RepID=UPI003976F7CC
MLKLKIAVFTFLFAMMGVLTVSADGDYRITDLNEVVRIDANGNANITKKVTYHFDDEMNGVYFKESLKKGTDSQSLQWGGLTSIEVSHNNGKSRLFYLVRVTVVMAMLKQRPVSRFKKKYIIQFKRMIS